MKGQRCGQCGKQRNDSGWHPICNEGELSRCHMLVIVHLREMILDKHHDLVSRTFCYKKCISLASTCFGRDSITRTAPIV